MPPLPKPDSATPAVGNPSWLQRHPEIRWAAVGGTVAGIVVSVFLLCFARYASIHAALWLIAWTEHMLRAAMDSLGF